MSRLIKWQSQALENIDLVYEKAKDNPLIENLLEQLETQALEEVKNNIGMIKVSDRALTPEDYDKLAEHTQRNFKSNGCY